MKSMKSARLMFGLILCVSAVAAIRAQSMGHDENAPFGDKGVEWNAAKPLIAGMRAVGEKMGKSAQLAAANASGGAVDESAVGRCYGQVISQLLDNPNFGDRVNTAEKRHAWARRIVRDMYVEKVEELETGGLQKLTYKKFPSQLEMLGIKRKSSVDIRLVRWVMGAVGSELGYTSHWIIKRAPFPVGDQCDGVW